MADNLPTLSPRYRIYGALGLGLFTAIAVRSIIIFEHIEPDWVRPVWYVAILGNFVFFYYRYQITAKRKRAVRKQLLIEKISTGGTLSDDDRDVLCYLLNSINKSPENINYLIISVFSLVAIAVDLAFVFFG